MTTRIDRLITLGIIIGMIFLTAMFSVGFFTQTAKGSVEFTGAAYQSTTTRPVSGVALTSPTVLSLGQGVFGSVVITGAATGVINIYDGTTTASHSNRATTTLATFPASTAAGTYVFDVQYLDGLIYEVVGTVGTSTITWKK